MKEIALQKQDLPPRIDHKEEEYKKRNKIISILVTIVLVIAIVLSASYILIFSIFSPVYIQGQSMAPTLNNFTLIANTDYREFGLMDTNVKRLERGDVAIFDVSNDQSGNYIVKRVIGLPNETIRIVDGGGSNPDYIRITNSDSTFVLEENYLTDAAKRITYSGSYGTASDLVLGDKQYFLLGDNRGNSQDSRAIGPVVSTKLTGKLIVIHGYYEVIMSYDGGQYSEETLTHYYAPWNYRFYL